MLPAVVLIQEIPVEVMRQSDMVIVLGAVVKIEALVKVPTTFSIVTSFKREVENINPVMRLLRMRMEGSLPKTLVIVVAMPCVAWMFIPDKSITVPATRFSHLNMGLDDVK